MLTSSSEISTPPGHDHADLPEQQHVREREVLDAQLVHDLPSVRVGAAFVTENGTIHCIRSKVLVLIRNMRN